MEAIYVVTGATGPTGTFAAEELRKAGAKVRAFVHKEDERAYRRRSHLLDYGAVQKALKGVTAAYLVYLIRHGLLDVTVYFDQAALDAGLKAIVNLSQISARQVSKSNAARDL
ncbi:NAD-dependent epimerase/dehydratase family protein [Bradyrhizobium genosp. P]|uniref:NAD-dependent epimerase/dehydratase family protein n=1 Tax=Bradyrhizobium genosp. P TaxID=83641 RepID=UPI003CEBB23C